MLSQFRCLTRNSGRSLSALRQGNNASARGASSALSASHSLTFNNTVKSDPRSSIFQIQYFRTSVAYRDEVVTVKTPACVTEGDVRWEKEVGDRVKEDEVVCEIETDRTSVQVSSPAAGVIVELLVPDGEKVKAGTPLFKLIRGAMLLWLQLPLPSPTNLHTKTMPPVPPVPAHAAIGTVFGSLIIGYARNPSLKHQLFFYAILVSSV
ncbi:dihydrolipoyllysine-residue succinyltransferase component of 2-oxoglutarate dehydrogenase complex, mitochondrial-like [Limanda limanda]|uniref:dihydrolipoyllysine-residue succinyltransferase component of 2-oxoglutarate dehydrogenase complex, mitochondrial-like n=1 Tax=Limanda limanda TaxID=27771 RepID=UPI0029C79321|nr:dihydrolipoyllysine-residue succinyltransferase component of 2-oxoglutarate dehydrogenase complex, mitochondrial-like [Limanda limanda]